CAARPEYVKVMLDSQGKLSVGHGSPVLCTYVVTSRLLMRVVLADLKSDRGFVSKDTVVGGYGSRLDPFTRVTAVISYLKKQFHDVPSVHMAYVAAILARAGHEVGWTREALMDGDVALVLSSLVDHKSETAWADEMRARGTKVGFIGITASKMPELYQD